MESDETNVVVAAAAAIRAAALAVFHKEEPASSEWAEEDSVDAARVDSLNRSDDPVDRREKRLLAEFWDPFLPETEVDALDIRNWAL